MEAHFSILHLSDERLRCEPWLSARPISDFRDKKKQASDRAIDQGHRIPDGSGNPELSVWLSELELKEEVEYNW